MATSTRFRTFAKGTHMGKTDWSRYNTCVCHPMQFGAKKAARRARRRWGKDMIKEQANDEC